MDDNITSNVLKFDTKVFRKVNTGGDKQHLQNDLHSILGNANAYIQDMRTWMFTIKWEILFSVLLLLKVSEQCDIAASKGNKILGLIRRNITY